MDKETLSHYGWIVILVLILAVLLALASPFGNFIAGAIKATTAGLFSVNQNALNAGGIIIPGQEFPSEPAVCAIEGHYKGDGRGEHGIAVTECNNGHTYTCECDSWVVPDCGKYTMYTALNGKSVYNAGEQLPCGYKPAAGDIYDYGDYQYCYGYAYSFECDEWSTNCGCDWQCDGWAVKCVNNIATPGPILSEINSEPVTNMRCTFFFDYDSAQIEVAPEIPATITDMPMAFARCMKLKNAPAIPEGVKGMYCTFGNCETMVTAPKIPQSVTEIYDCFQFCEMLTTTIQIPCHLSEQDIGGTSTPAVAEYYHYEGCPCEPTEDDGESGESGDTNTGVTDSLAGLYKTGTNYTERLKSWEELISEGTIAVVDGGIECKNTSIAGDLRMPNDGSITTLAYPAFSGCERLTGVIIPTSVTSIGGGSFGSCMSLTSIGPTGSGASVEIPNSVTSIAGSAFYNCRCLTNVVIPDSVISIGSYAFGGCSGISNLNLGSGVRTIEQQAFTGCNALTSVVIPDSVTDIGSDAFARCTNLTSVQLGSNVVNIGKQAFYMCSALSGEIELPVSVKSIGAYAFRSTALTKLTYNGTTSQWSGVSTTSPWVDNAISYIECTDGSVSP